MAAFNCIDDLYRSLIEESQNEEMKESILETLFRDQRYDLILYALEKGFSLSSGRVKQIKISGDLKLYQYLFRQQKLEFDLELMELAVISGKIETVKWLRSKECPWDDWTCAYAAKNGYLEVLKWLRSNKCPWGEWTCAYAALGGHLEVLQWLQEHGCPWDEDTCYYAAKYGHLDVLKWARENGCPWNEWVCWYAAQAGHLEVLKWARENGCPWDKDRCLQVSNDYPEVQEWINSN